MAETQEPPPLPVCDSQSEDDIDDLFKKELNRMTQDESVEVFGGSSASYRVPRSTSVPGSLPPQTPTGDCGIYYMQTVA